MADFARESMLDMFIFEMGQLLEQLEQLIIECEDGYSMDNINEIFRIMHTVKGSAAMMMFDNVSKTAHAVEDLFFYLREENPTDVNYSSLTDIVLEGMDFIKNELAKIAEGGEADTDPTEVIKRIKEFLCVLKGETTEETSKPVNTNQTKKEESVSKSNIEGKFLNKFECHLYFEEESGMENIRSFNVLNQLKDFGEILHTIPKEVTAVESEEIIKKDGFKFIIATDIGYEQIHEAINSTIYLKSFELNNYSPKRYKATIYFEDGCEMENVRAYTVAHNLKDIAEDIVTDPEDLMLEDNIEPIRDKGFKIWFSMNKDYEDVKQILEQTVFLKTLYLEEVNEEEQKIEEVIVEEPKVEEVKPEEVKKEETKKETKAAKDNKKAATNQQMISVSIGKLDQLLNLMGELVISEAMTTQNPDLDGLDLENFNKSARQLRKIIKDVQDSVMSMRMVTLDATFFKMQRIVRDMCKALGKNVDLIIEGRDTEVDKNIIEHIADPLMHIIRNSVDHGVELPEVRLKNGKEEKGTIKLEARNSGGEILISVKDDGAGINKAKVMAKAKAAGILKKPEEEYTDREICQFIFHAGLSTKEAVTNYSGRGVGMDVVTANIEAVGGSIVVESEEGYGTTTILKIPLTLAIIEGMLISMGGAKYTLPISSIKETFKAKKESIFMDPDGNEMITIRNDVYNIVRLYDFFNAKTDIKDIEEGVIIMLESEGRYVCLFVDELIGEQQVVVKSIPQYIKKVKGISGCTLLGNGDISLIIDIAGFFDN